MEAEIPNASTLPADAYGALLSLYSSLDFENPGPERKPLEAIRLLMSKNETSLIAPQIKAMKWLTLTRYKPDVAMRRDAEANLFTYAFEVKRGLFHPDVEYERRSTSRGMFSSKWPQGAVVHFTASRSENGDADAISTIQSMTNRHVGVHFVISRTGKIFQTLPLTEWGSHAGRSSYPGLGASVSSKLIGIEICNAGEVKKTERGYEPWWNTPGNPKNSYYSEDEVRYVEAGDNIRASGHYLKYSKEQEESLVRILLWLRAQKPDIFEIKYVVGNDEVSPDRKNDPGGSLSMTMPKFRAHLEALEKNSALPAAVSGP